MPVSWSSRRLALLIGAFVVTSSYLFVSILYREMDSGTPVAGGRVVHRRQPSWPPSKRFLDGLADEHNRLTVVGVNSGYIDMFHAWRRSASNVGVRNFVIVALDEMAYKDLYDDYHDRLLLPAFSPGLAGAAQWGTDLFNQLTRTRPAFIEAIVRLGYAVFYSDIDTFYRRNPFDEFDEILSQYPDTSVIVSEEGNPSNWCSCLIYFTGNPESVALLQAWKDHCAQNPSHDDQHGLGRAMSELLDRGQLHLYMVPKWKFSSGRTMFHEGYDWEQYPQGPIIVHANHLVGHDAKMDALLNRWKWDRTVPPRVSA